MIRQTLHFVCMLSSMLAFSQTPVTNTSVSKPNPDSAHFFLQKGLQEKQTGRRMEAFKNFEKAYKYDAGNKTVVSELAASYYDLRKYPQAKETYKKLETLGDQSPATYKQLMDLSFNLKQNDDVILYANKLKKADPSEKINFYIGKIHYQGENYGDAIKHLTAAAKEDEQNAEAPYMIARSYADMQNYKQAIPFFQKAIELDTSKNSWIYELALIYYAIHEDKNALKYMLLAGEKGYKRDNEYLENLGIAYLNAGQLDQGVAIMDEILKKRPSDMNVLNLVAEAYYYKGKFQKAIDYWDQVLFYDKGNASALYMIGMSYQKKGDKEKGEHLCDKAIEMDPSLSALKQKKQMPGAL
ncbi:MAG TPA: tetratricopeptide repeat protein [Chitinophagaceae bacterium]|nr:tetratricopeptide repeat protein [Chitinophagaceae bacterium]